MAEGEDAYPMDPFSDKGELPGANKAVSSFARQAALHLRDCFSHADIERILAEERSGADDGWTLVKRSDQVEVWKKETEGSPIKLIKVCSLLRGPKPRLRAF